MIPFQAVVALIAFTGRNHRGDHDLPQARIQGPLALG